MALCIGLIRNKQFPLVGDSPRLVPTQPHCVPAYIYPGLLFHNGILFHCNKYVLFSFSRWLKRNSTAIKRNVFKERKTRFYMSLCLNNRVLFTIEFQAIIALIFIFFLVYCLTHILKVYDKNKMRHKEDLFVIVCLSPWNKDFPLHWKIIDR